MKTRRITACFVAILFVFAMLFSHAFMIAEAHHDCSGKDCEICHVIAMAASVVRSIGLAIGAMTAFVAFAIITGTAAKKAARAVSFATPVALKVKLSN